jgi:hypothetical protein
VSSQHVANSVKNLLGVLLLHDVTVPSCAEDPFGVKGLVVHRNDQQLYLAICGAKLSE